MFDTYAYFKELTASGVSPEQAEAQIAAMQEAFKQGNLTTKHDLTELRSEFKHDMVELRAELKQDMVELRSEFNTRMNLLQWMLGLVAAGVITQLIKSFFGGA